MLRICAITLVMVAIVAGHGIGAEDAGPAKDVPELQVLENYQGNWDVTIGDGPIGGQVTARWILGGRFLEQTGVVPGQDGVGITITSLFTYDTQQKKLRSWTFISTGIANQAAMTWNAEKKTMTSVHPPDANGIRATVTADFSVKDKERWKFVYTDRDGTVVHEMQGENTRRQGTATQKTPAVNDAERSPQDKALDRFLGRWHSEYRAPKAEWTPVEKTGSADMVFTRELGGRMVRERARHSDETENTFLMLYDADQSKYRAWWFSSTGQSNESTGNWDAATQTFTWKTADNNGLNSTARHRFVGDKFDWSVLVENPEKVALFRMEGTSKRATAE